VRRKDQFLNLMAQIVDRLRRFRYDEWKIPRSARTICEARFKPSVREAFMGGIWLHVRNPRQRTRSLSRSDGPLPNLSSFTFGESKLSWMTVRLGRRCSN
jgi:hypothetical protein